MIHRIFKKDEQILEGSVFLSRVLDEILPQIDQNLYNIEEIANILAPSLKTAFRLLSPYISFRIQNIDRIFDQRFARLNIWFDNEDGSKNLKDEIRVRFYRLSTWIIGLGTNIDEHHYQLADLRVVKQFNIGLYNYETEELKLDPVIYSIRESLYKKRSTTLIEHIPTDHLRTKDLIDLENLVNNKLTSTDFNCISDEDLTEIYYFRDNILSKSQKVQAVNEKDIKNF